MRFAMPTDVTCTECVPRTAYAKRNTHKKQDRATQTDCQERKRKAERKGRKNQWKRKERINRSNRIYVHTYLVGMYKCTRYQVYIVQHERPAGMNTYSSSTSTYHTLGTTSTYCCTWYSSQYVCTRYYVKQHVISDWFVRFSRKLKNRSSTRDGPRSFPAYQGHARHKALPRLHVCLQQQRRTALPRHGGQEQRAGSKPSKSTRKKRFQKFWVHCQ